MSAPSTSSLSVELLSRVIDVKYGCFTFTFFTISYPLFVFGQSCGKVSASFTNVSSLALTAFDLVYGSLSVLRYVFFLDISK